MSYRELGDWLHEYNSFYMSLEYLKVSNKYMYIIYNQICKLDFILLSFSKLENKSEEPHSVEI